MLDIGGYEYQHECSGFLVQGGGCRIDTDEISISPFWRRQHSVRIYFLSCVVLEVFRSTSSLASSKGLTRIVDALRSCHPCSPAMQAKVEVRQRASMHQDFSSFL